MQYPFITDRELGESLTPHELFNKLHAYIVKIETAQQEAFDLPTEEEQKAALAKIKEDLPFELKLSISGLGTHAPDTIYPIVRYEDDQFIYVEENVPSVGTTAFREASEMLMGEVLTMINTRTDHFPKIKSYLSKSYHTNFCEQAGHLYDKRSLPTSKNFSKIITHVLGNSKLFQVGVFKGARFDEYIVRLDSDYFTCDVTIKELWGKEGDNQKVRLVILDYTFSLPNYHVHTTMFHPTRREFMYLMGGMLQHYLIHRNQDFTIKSDMKFRELVQNQNLDYFENAIVAIQRRDALAKSQAEEDLEPTEEV